MNRLSKWIIMFGFAMTTMQVFAVCTDAVTIKALYPREGGWVHIEVNELSDIDIYNCGQNNAIGMLLDVADSHGTPMGKKILLTSLMTALHTGATLKLCSTACDSRHPNYSELSYINEMKR